ncbi:MAG: hypothetical protein WBJ75_02805 [Pseudohongiellaceae bacterium]
MNTAALHSAIDSLSRVTRHFLLLTLLLSSVAFGGGVDRAPFASALESLPSQLDQVASDHAALVGQQDTLRAIKRFDHDDSSDAPWLHPATTALKLPVGAQLPPLLSATPAIIAVSERSHAPRAPPALSW